MLQILTAGESHGRALSVIIEGLPAGIDISPDFINHELSRRQVGYGRGDRMKIEKDCVEILSGIRHGYTTGAPISFLIQNRDWSNWTEEMSVTPVSEDWTSPRSVEVPRPGHADLAGAIKFHQPDMRNILERASARNTATNVAAGALCRKFLLSVGIKVASSVLRINGAGLKKSPDVWTEDFLKATEASDVRCADTEAAVAMRNEIDCAKSMGDTVGGVFEIRAWGLPAGIGSHTTWTRKIDGKLAGALMSVQAIKGVEIGLGFEVAERCGSNVHDEIIPSEGAWPFYRPTNNAGGIEGGMTNGEPVIIRCAMKPIPTLMTPLKSVELSTLTPHDAHSERSDVCAVPAASIVGEAVVCCVLADALLETFSGSHLDDVISAIAAQQLHAQKLWGSAS